jgi:tetratricopeptide (TPR) repeat protein
MKRRGLCLLLVLAGCAANYAERNNAGNALYEQGNFRDAVHAYQAAQVDAPDQPEPYYNAGNALAQAGDIDRALAALNQVLKTADESLAAQAYYNLGNVYFGMSRYEDAVLAYQQALLRNSDDADARYNLELALRRIQPPMATTSAPDAQNQATPTSQSGSGASPTPSPEAQGGTAQATATGGQETAMPPTSPEQTMSPDEAARRLDAIQQQQQTLSQVLSPAPVAPSGKDW